jgi:hypothetical protein
MVTPYLVFYYFFWDLRTLLLIRFFPLVIVMPEYGTTPIFLSFIISFGCQNVIFNYCFSFHCHVGLWLFFVVRCREESLFEPRRKRDHDARCVSDSCVLLAFNEDCINTIYDDAPLALAKLRLQILTSRASLEDFLLQPAGAPLLHTHCKKELNEGAMLVSELPLCFESLDSKHCHLASLRV